MDAGHPRPAGDRVVAVLVIPDGAAQPLRGGVPTALEAARTPVLDALAATGEVARVAVTPAGVPAGSEAGVPALLGHAPGAGARARARSTPPATASPVPKGMVAVARRRPARGRRARRGAGMARMIAAALRRRVDARPPPRALRPGGAAPGGRPPALRHVWADGARASRRARSTTRTVVVAARGAAAGCARLLGAALVVPPGATGDVDTDLHAKAPRGGRRDRARRAARRRPRRRARRGRAPPRRAAPRSPALEALDAALLGAAERRRRARRRHARRLPRPRHRPARRHARRRRRCPRCAGAAASRRRAGPDRMTEARGGRGAGAAGGVAAARRGAPGGGGVIARVVIGGTSSGAGKTTVATGLLAALAARGLRPTRLQGRPGLHRPQLPRARQRAPRAATSTRSSPGPSASHRSFVTAAPGPTSPSSRASWASTTARRAAASWPPPPTWPSSCARPSCSSSTPPPWRARPRPSSTATPSYDPEVDVAGVILNRVGSEGHAQLLREAIEPLGVPVLGVAAPRRRPHRARAPPRARAGGRARDARARDARPRSARRSRRAATSTRCCAWRAPRPTSRARRGSPIRAPIRSPARIAVARGPAFSFHYEENLELLRARRRGARRPRPAGRRGAAAADRRPRARRRLPRGLRRGAVGQLGAARRDRRLRRARPADPRRVRRPALPRAPARRAPDVRRRSPIAGHMTPGLSLGYREATAAADHAGVAGRHRGARPRVPLLARRALGDRGAPAWTLRARGSSAPRATSRRRPRQLPAHALGGHAGRGRALVAAAAAGMRRPSRRSHDAELDRRRRRARATPSTSRSRRCACCRRPIASSSRRPARAGVAGRAEVIVAEHVPAERIERVRFAMGDDGARARNWNAAGEAIAAVVRAGGTAVVRHHRRSEPVLDLHLRRPHRARAGARAWRSRTVPGITAMQDLAARSGTVLAEGSEPLTLFPYTAGDGRLRGALGSGDTVVVYKGGRHLPEVLDAVRDAGRLDRQRLRRAARPARARRSPAPRAHGQRAVHVDGDRAGRGATATAERSCERLAAHGAEADRPVETARPPAPPSARSRRCWPSSSRSRSCPPRRAGPTRSTPRCWPPSSSPRARRPRCSRAGWSSRSRSCVRARAAVRGAGPAGRRARRRRRARRAVAAGGIAAQGDARRARHRRARRHDARCPRSSPASSACARRASSPRSAASRCATCSSCSTSCGGCGNARIARGDDPRWLWQARAPRRAAPARWPCAAFSAASACTPRCSPAATTAACRRRASRRRRARCAWAAALALPAIAVAATVAVRGFA